MHIFLVGPPGIGKSSVAPRLAHHFGAAVVELDREIERRAGKSCKDVIEQDGMDRFREVESSALQKLAPTPSWVVVDTGGGAPIREENRALMRRLGLIVGLRGSLDRVTSGIAATMAKRPNQSMAPRDRAREVLRERRVAYTDTDVTFDVDGASVERALARSPHGSSRHEASASTLPRGKALRCAHPRGDFSITSGASRRPWVAGARRVVSDAATASR